METASFPANHKLDLRPAVRADLDAIWEIIQQAILRRKQEGSRQWQDGYPNPQTLTNDIAKGWGYVLEERGEVWAYAAIITEAEPAYEALEGTWLSEGAYVVVHRVAVHDKVLGKGLAKQLFQRIEAWSLERNIHSIKVDTNFDNQPMLAILERLGYTYCGEVYYRGAARRAYEKIF